jgi:hypothetical protein
VTWTETGLSGRRMEIGTLEPSIAPSSLHVRVSP